MDASRDTLTLRVRSGFTKTAENGAQVNGTFEIDGLDWELCAIFLFEYSEVPCGNNGSFTGSKTSLRTFAENFCNMRINISHESYGCNTAQFAGFLFSGRRVWECRIEIDYSGDIKYVTDE